MKKATITKNNPKGQRPETNSCNFSLIDGIFDFPDAQEVLMTAYQAKIDFHKLKAWSKSERGEVGVDHHTVRALELEIERDKIRELLQSNAKENKNVNIVCKLRIKFNP